MPPPAPSYPMRRCCLYSLSPALYVYSIRMALLIRRALPPKYQKSPSMKRSRSPVIGAGVLAAGHLETARRLLERVGARNELGKALRARAEVARRDGEHGPRGTDSRGRTRSSRSSARSMSRPACAWRTPRSTAPRVPPDAARHLRAAPPAAFDMANSCRPRGHRVYLRHRKVVRARPGPTARRVSSTRKSHEEVACVSPHCSPPSRGPP